MYFNPSHTSPLYIWCAIQHNYTAVSFKRVPVQPTYNSYVHGVWRTTNACFHPRGRIFHIAHVQWFYALYLEYSRTFQLCSSYDFRPKTEIMQHDRILQPCAWLNSPFNKLYLWNFCTFIHMYVCPLKNSLQHIRSIRFRYYDINSNITCLQFCISCEQKWTGHLEYL